MRTVSDRGRATGRYLARRNVSGRDAAAPHDVLTGLSAFVSATLSQMLMFHRIVVVVLLACVPFQAAAGATGLACPNGAHHSHSSIALADNHDATAPDQHRALDASDAHDYAVDDASPGPDDLGKCSLCNECCFSAAPVPTLLLDVVQPDDGLKVSLPVAPAIRSHTGDSLFRPPRTENL